MKKFKMSTFPTTQLLVLLLSCHFLSNWASGQVISVKATEKPQAIFTSNQLPFADYGHSLHYDGEESILIFSANSEGVRNRAIFRLNITSEEIDRFTPIPFRARYAPLVRLQDRSYMYIGNDQTTPRVLNFQLVSNSSRIVHELPYDLAPTKTSFPSNDNPDKIYLVGSTAIHEFDSSTYCLTHIRNLTGLEFSISRMGTFGDHLYIFTYEGWQELGQAVAINRHTLEQTNLGETNVQFTRSDSGGSGTIATKNYLYVLGGYARGNPFPTDGILQYSPAENIFKFIRIDGFPPGFEGSYGLSPSMLFVEKLNRIYFFGGGFDGSSIAQPRNHIWYIDVGLMEENDVV